MTCNRGCCGSPREHYASVALSMSDNSVKDRKWARDADAYKRLRADGQQPKAIDGCRDLEALAQSSFEVTTGRVLPDEATRRKVDETMAQL